jgi:hypothetical protein
MSRNTALVTTAAQTAAESDLDDYAAGVASHLGGDWQQHRQLNVISGNYTATAGVLASFLARMQLTDDAGATQVVSAPCFFVADLPVVAEPVIVIQPVSLSVVEGEAAIFRVYAASSTELTYQWQFKATDETIYAVISGATFSVYVIPQPIAANAGAYRVVVSNTGGTVISTTANLTVA